MSPISSSVTVKEAEILRAEICTQIIKHLYSEAFLHWNRVLDEFIKKNTALHGRTGKYAVHYNGRRYMPISLDRFEDEQTPFCLILHPEHPELEEEMRVISDAMDQLETERNAVSRFIHGLLMLGVTFEQFGAILGEHIREQCSASALSRILDCSGNNCPVQEHSIKEYTDTNQDIVDMIGERRLINLITVA